jgi:diaminohydroxyphosphoribosylaminopyrimidine deaminase/5-amino-6-(5-phosphoribosylamino)uracil reductase
VREGAPPRVPPVRVVFDRRARLPLDAALVRTAREAPTLVVAAPDADPARVSALAGRGVDVLRAASLAEALAALRARGVRSALVEGGAGLAGALLAERLVDRLVISPAPVVLVAGALGAFGALDGAAAASLDPITLGSAETHGDDVMATYALR